jgi:hypothetical protein
MLVFHAMVLWALSSELDLPPRTATWSHFIPATMLTRLPGDLNHVRQAFDSVQDADQLTKVLDL